MKDPLPSPTPLANSATQKVPETEAKISNIIEITMNHNHRLKKSSFLFSQNQFLPTFTAATVPLTVDCHPVRTV